MHLGRWNRLTVFRHDWGVWLQLNGGKHQEGRSQVLLTKVNRMLGLVGLELKRGFQAQLRRLTATEANIKRADHMYY